MSKLFAPDETVTEDDIDDDYDGDIHMEPLSSEQPTHMELLPSEQPQDETPAANLPASEELAQVLLATKEDLKYLYPGGMTFERWTKFDNFDLIISNRYNFSSNANVKDDLPPNTDVYKELEKVSKYLGGYSMDFGVTKEDIHGSLHYCQALSFLRSITVLCNSLECCQEPF